MNDRPIAPGPAHQEGASDHPAATSEPPVTAPPTMSPCPSWCAEDHQSESWGFFHAAAPVTVQIPAQTPRGETAAALVQVRRFESPDDGRVDPTLVELSAPSNAGMEDLTELAPVDALRLAAELVRAAVLAMASD